ncbi:MAG TPA: hypothetical protein VF766_09610, partial [Pyrinomonadaceae bacterium]
RGFAVLTANLPSGHPVVSEVVLEWRVRGPNPFGVPLWGLQAYKGDLPQSTVPVIDELHQPWSIDPGPGMGLIVRAQSRLFDLTSSTNLDAFHVPSSYRRVCDLPSYWKYQN